MNLQWQSRLQTPMSDADHDATYHFGFRIGLGTVHAGGFFSFIWARGLELGVWSWAGKKKNWFKYWEAVLASVFCLLLFPGSGFVRGPFPFFVRCGMGPLVVVWMLGG